MFARRPGGERLFFQAEHPGRGVVFVQTFVEQRISFLHTQNALSCHRLVGCKVQFEAHVAGRFEGCVLRCLFSGNKIFRARFESVFGRRSAGGCDNGKRRAVLYGRGKRHPARRTADGDAGYGFFQFVRYGAARIADCSDRLAVHYIVRQIRERESGRLKIAYQRHFRFRNDFPVLFCDDKDLRIGRGIVEGDHARLCIDGNAFVFPYDLVSNAAPDGDGFSASDFVFGLETAGRFIRAGRKRSKRAAQHGKDENDKNQFPLHFNPPWEASALQAARNGIFHDLLLETCVQYKDRQYRHDHGGKDAGVIPALP